MDADGFAEATRLLIAAINVLESLQRGAPVEDGALAEALHTLEDPSALAVAIDALVDRDPEDPGNHSLEAPLLEAASSSLQIATVHLLCAVILEAGGDCLAAEQHLELAVAADGTLAPAVDRLAWYASDRGDAVRAISLWRCLRGSDETERNIDELSQFARDRSTLGRNDSCWCGSGRKYKQCHIGSPAPASLPDRVGWLCRKAAAYLGRRGPEAEHAVMEVAEVLVAEGQELGDLLGDDPLVIDLVLTEGGWFERFIQARGPLLPPDEALLALAWLTVDRSVHEIISITAGIGLELRDLRTGDVLEVRERAFSKQARIGRLVCARVVPDGSTHQLVGAVFTVPPGRDRSLLELLDVGDPQEVAAWMHDLRAPPTVRLPSGEVIRPRLSPDQADAGPALAPPPVDADTLEQIQSGMERRWCDEPVPALDGLTPREAAADPTRLQELERLLDYYDSFELPRGAFGLRSDELRRLLGLDAPGTRT